MDLRYKFQ